MAILKVFLIELKPFPEGKRQVADQLGIVLATSASIAIKNITREDTENLSFDGSEAISGITKVIRSDGLLCLIELPIIDSPTTLEEAEMLSRDKAVGK